MGALLFCNSCDKWVVFGEYDRKQYNELLYIFGGKTVIEKCPNCRERLSASKQK